MRIDADVVVASSSGWAHGFARHGRTVVYCHNPARWLYQTDEYLGGPAWRSPIGPPILALRPLPASLGPACRRWASTVYLANSRVVQQRIATTYGRDAELLPPPHGMDPSALSEPVPDLADWAAPATPWWCPGCFPTRTSTRSIEAVRGTDRRLVVVGHGPEEARLRATLPDHVRLLGGLSDAQLRSVYAGAGVLIAAEPRGLRPDTAGGRSLRRADGRAARRRLPRDRPGGRDRAVLRPAGAADIAASLELSDHHTWDPDRLTARAEKFGEARFIDRIRAIALGDGQSRRGSTAMRPDGIKLLPWLVGAVDLVMIAIATVLAIRFRVSLPIFDTAGDVLENSALASIFFVGTWLVLLVFFGTYRAARLRSRHGGVQARRQRLLLHRGARGDDGLPHAVPPVARILRAAVPHRRAPADPRPTPDAARHPATPRRRSLQREGPAGRHPGLHR